MKNKNIGIVLDDVIRNSWPIWKDYLIKNKICDNKLLDKYFSIEEMFDDIKNDISFYEKIDFIWQTKEWQDVRRLLSSKLIAEDYVNLLYDNGNKIYIYDYCPNDMCIANTKEWMNNHHIPYDNLIYSKNVWKYIISDKLNVLLVANKNWYKNFDSNIYCINDKDFKWEDIL